MDTLIEIFADTDMIEFALYAAMLMFVCVIAKLYHWWFDKPLKEFQAELERERDIK